MESKKTKTTITYLEMVAPPRLQAEVPENTMVLRAENLPVHFYRYLYNTVGEKWLWYERRLMGDEQLEKIIHNPDTEVYVLYAGGVPAGYSELDLSDRENINLAYFGLMPEYIGKGYGKFFLNWTVNRAWSYKPARFWVHTCTLDAPNALDVYKKSGFVPYKTEEKEIGK